MKKHFALLSFIALAIAMISWGGLANAQQTDPPAQQPSTQTQQPPDAQAPASQSGQQPGQAQPGQQGGQAQPPDQNAQSDADGSKEFIGTVVKQGDKYMFQDAATGTTYDIDHQDDVKKFEGKKVRVHGTLDANGKMIHVQ